MRVGIEEMVRFQKRMMNKKYKGTDYGYPIYSVLFQVTFWHYFSVFTSIYAVKCFLQNSMVGATFFL